jgi:hypothetical protein
MMSKVMLLLTGCCVALAPLACAAGGSVDMQPGEWSITMKTNMEGLPFKMPPMTFKQCLNGKDLVPKSSTAPGQTQGPNCEFTDQKIVGNTVSWSVYCTEQRGTTKGKGSVTYSGTTFSGSSDVVMTSGSQSQNVKTELSGKWLGPCKK